MKESTIFAYPVRDPSRYGVVEFDQYGDIKSLVEKPDKPLSNFAVTGLYFYDNSVIRRTKKLDFSARGELEITDLNQGYLDDECLKVEIMGRGMTWLDMGTFDSLQEASAFIRSLQVRQGLSVGCPEEVAWRNGWIDDGQLLSLAKPLLNSGYGKYLVNLLDMPFI